MLILSMYTGWTMKNNVKHSIKTQDLLNTYGDKSFFPIMYIYRVSPVQIQDLKKLICNMLRYIQGCERNV